MRRRAGLRVVVLACAAVMQGCMPQRVGLAAGYDRPAGDFKDEYDSGWEADAFWDWWCDCDDDWWTPSYKPVVPLSEARVGAGARRAARSAMSAGPARSRAGPAAAAARSSYLHPFSRFEFSYDKFSPTAARGDVDLAMMGFAVEWAVAMRLSPTLRPYLLGGLVADRLRFTSGSTKSDWNTYAGVRAALGMQLLLTQSVWPFVDVRYNRVFNVTNDPFFWWSLKAGVTIRTHDVVP